MSDEIQVQATTADKIRREAVELGRFILGVAVLFLLITTVLIRTFYIPSSSMEPTLEVQDRVIVLNFVYGWSRHSLQFGMGGALPEGEGRIFGRLPGRGDVIVFRHPDPGKREHLIKRVIGLPGDEIRMRSGRLYINGEVVPRESLGKVEYRDRWGRIVAPTRYEETLPGGRRHAIYEHTDDGQFDDTPAFTVPEGNVFVMGDNRDESSDSRNFLEDGLGYVPVEFIVGRAATVLFTLHRCRREEGLACPKGRVLQGL
jgi:signal peptidase I